MPHMTQSTHPQGITQRFLIFALVVTAVVWTIVSIPYISNALYKVSGFDPLSLIGSGGVLGPKKIAALNYAVFFGGGLLLVGYLLTIIQPGRFLRGLILVALLPIVLVANTWIAVTPQGGAAARIHIGQLPSVDYNAIFNDAAIGRETISSFDALYDAVENNYQRHAETLHTAWNIRDDDELRTLFYLNTASHFFAYGNKTNETRSGCAASNEANGFQRRDKKQLGVQFYTQSPIGCCTDYTSLVKFLLDRANIENRVIRLKMHGHYFNEVRLNGHWRALDAQAGLYYLQAWDEIVETEAPFQALIFPVLSLDTSHPDTYRPELGKFRQHILMVAATGAEFAQYPQEFTVEP